MRRPRVAVFLPDLRGGGAERTVLGVAATLAERCHVEVVLAQAGGALAGEVPPSVHVVELGARRVASSIPALVRYLRRTRPDAVLSALNHANVVAIIARAASGTKPRLVVAEHSHLSTATAHAHQRRDRILPRLLGVLYPRADGIVAVSEGVADDLAARTGIARDRIDVIPNPIDVDDLRRRAHERPTHPWSADRSTPLLVAAGRLTAQKDFPNLLEAVALCRQRAPVRLVILGEGEERPALEAQIRSLGLDDAVSLPGFTSNPYSLLRRADLFVLSSRWEGLPTVLLEALAVGTPVVSTRCPSGPSEILRDAPDRLVPVGDPRALADAILATLDAPAAAPADLEAYAPEVVRRAYADVLGIPLPD